ncbi:DDB1- and CUL4-associated factor 12 [Mortierella polycephala]|uniref:DDB1- and CUL4-associated factor 12 n=1 Tax=Mortierella polycephala TaxID=41804 RepID=A0A9P6Q5H9_9FUNG|nr:DDB1- and CUL4-associated factor 12 [Mortierella polycephala]
MSLYNKVAPGTPTTSVLTSLRKREYQTRQQQLRQGTCRRIGCPPRPREDFFIYDHAIISPSSPDISGSKIGVEAGVEATKESNTSSDSDSSIKTMTSSSSLPLIHPRVTSAVPMTCCYSTDTDLPGSVMDWNSVALLSGRRGRKAASSSSSSPSSSSPSSSSSGRSLGKTLIMVGQAMGFGSAHSSSSPPMASLAPEAITDPQMSFSQLGGGGRRMSTPSMPFTSNKSHCHHMEIEPSMSQSASMTLRPNSALSTSHTSVECPSASFSPTLQPLADEANGYCNVQQQNLRPLMKYGYGYRSTDSTVDMVSSRIPTIIAEREYALEGYDKVFATTWITNEDVLMGTKCNKLIVLNVLTGRQVILGRLDESLEESTSGVLSRLANLAKEQGNTKLANTRFKNLLPTSNEDLTFAQEASSMSSGRSVLESIGMRFFNPGRRLSSPVFSTTNNSANTIATTPRTTSGYDITTSNTNTPADQNPSTEAPSSSASSGVRSLSINPSRTLLAVGAGFPFQVTIFSVPGFVPMGVMYGHTDLVFSLEWVTDTILVSGSRDGSMRVWTMGSPVITTLSSVSGPIQARLPVLTRTEDNTKVRDLSYNNGTGQLMTLAAEGVVNLWDRESYTKIFKLKLAQTSETVCLASNGDANLFAVGSLANISIIDPRSSSIVHEADSCDIERDVRWGVRSLDFKSHIITTGGGSGRIGYYDLRAQRYLDGFENGQSTTTFQEIGPGWMNRDTAYAVSIGGFMIRNAVYAMEYDSTGTRLFTAGGPLQLGLCGSYAGMWS